jgi:hypothetical protein
MSLYGKPFKASAGHWDRNVADAARWRVVPAQMGTLSGDPVTGVAIFSGESLRGVLPEADAWRIADEIADALEGDRG